MSKLLAEWFWTDRWSGSDGWLLPMAPRGLYREMLTQAWKREASLPGDLSSIRSLCNVSEADWDTLWPAVKPFWKEVDGRLVNETQVVVYAEAKGKHERAQARAQAGAQAKHNRVLKDKPPSPSPSPSPDNGTGKPAHPSEPPMPNPTPVPEWEAQAKAIWSMHLGGENDYVYADLIAVVRRFGAAKTLIAWEAYCKASAANQGGKFASARSFAQKPGPWMERPADGPRHRTIAELKALEGL